MSDDPRFYVVDTVGHDGFAVFDSLTDDQLAHVGHDTMLGIADNEAGGIIAYALTPDHADAIVARLNTRHEAPHE